MCRDFDGRIEILHTDKVPTVPSLGGVWQMVSHGCSTIEESRIKWGMPEDPCRICGQHFGTNYYEPLKSELLKQNICFDCDFWSKYVARKDDPKIARIDHDHYVITPDDPNTRAEFKGYSGARFKIHFHDGRKVVTNNLWHQGRIPNRWHEQLPDNAVFIKPQP